ncbi:DUF3556 domain-containing protein [Streptomyces griseoaurantiacus]|uniref:DUF3556 domain-containing protein n=1 Tax=Streptomyces griseoaurantiacus TaxID=68213 RepID=A0ABZ1V9Q0_9ACTN|nr:DUF3556 domain-containing protein [Streptomyces jietaisiensis]GHE82565.1 hypothetical protein GCM10018782_64330 [Streptomyces griseoaurantiacus]
MCGRFRPKIGNIRSWIRPGTLGVAPWGSRVPFTSGDERTWFDLALFAGVLAAFVYPLAAQAEPVPSEFLPGGTSP